ncbi:MAG: hypothetical protein R2909_03340 [Gemmatimonadales bacterium]
MLRPISFATMLLVTTAPGAGAQSSRFEVTLSAAAHPGPLTGRLLVAVSKRTGTEPRLLIGPQGPALFAVDLEGLRPGEPVSVDGGSLGFPMPLGELPAGDYRVQAIVNVYDRLERADGHTIWVPWNDGRQEFFVAAAGNLLSEPRDVHLGAGETVRLELSRVIEEAPLPPDTKWVKRVRIQSEKLTRFWGRPVYVHATVLLPDGFDEHPERRYPVIFTLGHTVPFSFTTDSSRVRGLGEINPVTGLETGFDFYRAWSAPGFPRMVAISFEQQSPYFPDSYSVNSANNGPYGDAIVEEIIPELERRFRLIGKPYARIVEGASTGGWQTLALQLQHPDFLGGAWSFQPDPIDFRKYQLTNIYEDTSAFAVPAGQFVTAERPFRRTMEGQVLWSTRLLSLFEEVLGSRGRGGYQLTGWEAVFGPVGDDGYPRPLWNKLTGTIDHEVAGSMREHGFDLREYAERNWSVLGSKLRGKLHLAAGDMDDFHLNLAVYEFESFIRRVDPDYPAEFVYGRPTKGHAWHKQTWADLVRTMARYVKGNAPPGEPTDWAGR